MKFPLKVFTNKRNGQSLVLLPKKAFSKIPKEVEIEIPDGLMRKTWRKIKCQ